VDPQLLARCTSMATSELFFASTYITLSTMTGLNW
jgi:hypothetical protein